MSAFSEVVCDASALMDGRVAERWKGKVIVPSEVLDKVIQMAKEGDERGFVALQTLRKLQGRFQVKQGRVEELLEGRGLITADPILRLVAEAREVPVLFLERAAPPKIPFTEYLTPDTMSLHLRENCKAVRKRGKPGKWEKEEVGSPIPSKKLAKMAEEVVEIARRSSNSSVELESEGMTVLQIGDLRTVILRPPFSDRLEITVTRPVLHLSLEDYRLPAPLRKRLLKAEGVLIAGPPGSGKSTFASALAEFYSSKGLLVKTLENPRDLNVDPSISQYDARNPAATDALLLSRPDRVIFDELRTSEDFQKFVDLRMAGIGMVGVVHASRPIDGVQRFLEKAELGLIPQVVDTVLFFEEGRPAKVLSLKLKVKVPTGMASEDLARPVIEVRDFFSSFPEYEIYKFGEEAVVLNVAELLGPLAKELRGKKFEISGRTIHLQERSSKDLRRRAREIGFRLR